MDVDPNSAQKKAETSQRSNPEPTSIADLASLSTPTKTRKGKAKSQPKATMALDSPAPLRRSTRVSKSIHASLNEQQLASGAGSNDDSAPRLACPFELVRDIEEELADYDARNPNNIDEAQVVAATTPKELTMDELARKFIVSSEDKKVGPQPDPTPVSHPTTPIAQSNPTTPPTVTIDQIQPQTKSKKKKSRRRARNNKQGDRDPLAAAANTMSWPKVNPALNPRITGDTLKKLRADGTYAMDELEAKAHQSFMTRNAIVYGHDQRDPAKAVRLFKEDDSHGIIPHSVMWDSGAEVGICISTNLAKRLELTWSPGLQLIGVGGAGGAKGQADQEIIVRLGGDGTPNDTWSTELNGVFAIKVRPIIMTDEMTDNIGHNVLIGTHPQTPSCRPSNQQSSNPCPGRSQNQRPQKRLNHRPTQSPSQPSLLNLDSLPSVTLPVC